LAIFLDTGFYLGLIHPKDDNAMRAGEILNELSQGIHGLLYTSNLIIAETTTLTASRTLANPHVLKGLERMIWGENRLAEVLIVTPEIETKAWTLFQKVNMKIKTKKKLMSFVDVTSVILAQLHQIDMIVSFDSHFDQFLTRMC
jgi:predicted nucleic acid-binding protein